MDQDRQPAVRARSARDLLAYVEVFRPGALERVYATMPSASRAVILETPNTGWIPLEHDHFVVDGVVEVLGRDGGLELWRTFLKGHLESPMLRALFEGFVRLFGLTPGTVAGFAPRGWGQAYRDFGALVLDERGKGHAAMRIVDIAPQVFDFPNYFISIEGTFGGMLDATDTPGTVEMRVDRASREVSAVLRW